MNIPAKHDSELEVAVGEKTFLLTLRKHGCVQRKIEIPNEFKDHLASLIMGGPCILVNPLSEIFQQTSRPYLERFRIALRALDLAKEKCKEPDLKKQQLEYEYLTASIDYQAAYAKLTTTSEALNAHLRKIKGI